MSFKDDYRMGRAPTSMFAMQRRRQIQLIERALLSAKDKGLIVVGVDDGNIVDVRWCITLPSGTVHTVPDATSMIRFVREY